MLTTNFTARRKKRLLHPLLIFIVFLLPPVAVHAQAASPGVKYSLNMQGSVDCDDVTLTWNEASEKKGDLSDRQSAYNLYRGDSLLNQEPIQDTIYLDQNVHVGNYMYYLEVISGSFERQDYSDSTEVEVEQYYGEIDMNVDNLSLSWSLENENVQNAEFTGYTIYREGVLIQEDYQSEFFILYEPPEVPRQYCVEANYSNGCTSQMACDSVYPVSDSLFPPQNFEASVDPYPVSTSLQWNTPESSTNNLEGYKLFRFLQPHIDDPDEWTLVEEDIDDTTYTDTNWDNLSWGLYGYALKAVYQEGNSVAVKSDSLCNDCMSQVFFTLNPIPDLPLDSVYIELSQFDGSFNISGYYGDIDNYMLIFKGSYSLMMKGTKTGPAYYWSIEVHEGAFIINPTFYLRKPRYLSTITNCNNVVLEWDWTFLDNDPEVIDMLAGFNVYRNDSLITSEPVDSTWFVDEDLPIGEYEYYVTAAFKDSTESQAQDTIPVSITKDYGNTGIQIAESHINWEINDTTQVEVAGYNLYKNEELIGEMLDTVSIAFEYPDETGEYAYCVEPVFADSCTGRKACDTIKTTAGINASELSDFIRIYPNPTQAKLHVESPEKIINVRCYNLKGTRIFRRQKARKDFTLQTHRLSPGMYYLHFISEEGRTGVKKIVVE
ncbi:MAG: T9SS type A sorting domain-containing protein [Bacteroidales bacterium]|nr:T9SS type A sorting domain-containing protein [Bacteroidales bacterium]MCF8337056.1 T9SS type A sorting domain-containing protein [Bacteroidales bacterium]